MRGLRIQIRLFTLFFVLFLAGCAGVASKYDDQDFVPRKDLRVVHLVREGLDYYSRSRYLDAEFRLRQALYLQPDLENVRLSLAIVLENQGLYDEALELLQDLRASRPEYVKYLLATAHVYTSAGRYRDALATYEEAYVLVGGAPAENGENFGIAASIAQSISVLAYRLGLEEMAQCYSQAALNYQRGSILLTARHMRILTARGYHKLAIGTLGVGEEGEEKEVLTQDPLLLTQAALAYFSMGDRSEAERLAERALESLTIDAGGETEMKLLLSVASYLDEKDNPLTEEELEDLTVEEEEERNERLVFLSGNLAESSDAVYWPAPLVSYLAQIHDEIEESGVLEEKGLVGQVLELLRLELFNNQPGTENTAPKIIAIEPSL